jgi:hypothetical protein
VAAGGIRVWLPGRPEEATRGAVSAQQVLCFRLVLLLLGLAVSAKKKGVKLKHTVTFYYTEHQA